MPRRRSCVLEIITEKRRVEIDGKEKTFRCFVFGEEVLLIDGVCQEDCSIEECNLNRDNQPDNKQKEGLVRRPVRCRDAPEGEFGSRAFCAVLGKHSIKGNIIIGHISNWIV